MEDISSMKQEHKKMKKKILSVSTNIIIEIMQYMR